MFRERRVVGTSIDPLVFVLLRIEVSKQSVARLSTLIVLIITHSACLIGIFDLYSALLSHAKLTSLRLVWALVAGGG